MLKVRPSTSFNFLVAPTHRSFSKQAGADPSKPEVLLQKAVMFRRVMACVEINQ